MTTQERQAIGEAISNRANSQDAIDRNATAQYVPERTKGAYCEVCIGPALRGCYVGRHPYAYMARLNGSVHYKPEGGSK